MAGHPPDPFQNCDALPRVECPEPVEGLLWVYLLVCANRSFYTGHTSDVAARLKLHENGFGARHTRLLAPFRLVYVEGPLTKELALKREQQLKKWSRQKKLALINGRAGELRKLSKSKDSHTK